MEARMIRRLAFGRRQLLRLLGSAAVVAAGSTLEFSPALATSTRVRVGDENLSLEFDDGLRSRIFAFGKQVTDFTNSEVLLIADNADLGPMVLTGQSRSVSRVAGFPGSTFTVSGISGSGIEKTVELTFNSAMPGLAALVTRYRNSGSKAVKVRGWRNAAHTLPFHSAGFWSFSGASYADRRDWIQPMPVGFEQRNFMGMNASDYGGGTPVADIWNRDIGLAVGHLETTPKLVALPIGASADGASIAIESDQPAEILPGETLSTHTCFLAVHRGDCFAPLTAYRKAMVARGTKPAKVPAAAYSPMWCAWGYERNFTIDQILGTLPKVKELGIDWVVMDDGWQTAEGDWYLDPSKFPNGDADMIDFVKKVKAAGLKPRLWLAPLAVDPGTDLLRNSTDMLLLDQNGAVNDVTWWNAFSLCPAYQPTIDNCMALVRKIIGEWGFEGLKLDGQHLNGAPACYNKAHKHSRPEEAHERLPDFWKALHETATAINPDAVIEFCPCGTSFAYHSLPHVNQVPASDPLSSWQIRLKAKTTKALMGPSAPFSGDHVELSDDRSDFASTVGVGGVVSTKFTWPRDTDNPSGVLPEGGYVLDAAKEADWRRWIDIYRTHELPLGDYRGDLYDIGFDRPETHVIAKGTERYFAFYAKDFSGAVELRGLDRGRYRVTDIETGRTIAFASAQSPRIEVSFARHLLLRATPTGART